MYASQDSLFRLISTLQPKEKEDILKSLRQTARGKSNYQRLFGEMAASKEYDETRVKYKMEKYIAKGSFSVVKNQLNERLLEHLSSRHDTTRQRLHRWLDYVEILVMRQLYPEAMHYCEKVEKEAFRNGLMYLIIEVNYWRGAILQRTERENFVERMDEIAKKVEKATQLLAYNIKIAAYYYQVVSLVHQFADVRNKEFNQKMAALKNHELFAFDATNEEYPFYMACYLAMAKDALYKFSGDFEQSLQQQKIVWERLRADWKFFCKSKRQEVISTITNYLEALSKTAHVEEFKNLLEYAETVQEAGIKNDAYLQAVCKMFRLLELVSSEKENIRLSDIAPFVKFYDSKGFDDFIELKKESEFLLARAFFNCGKYAEAAKYLAVICNEYKRTDVRSDMYEYALFMDFLNDFTLSLQTSFEKMKVALPGKAETYYNHIRRKAKENEFVIEDTFLNFFDGITSDSNRVDVALHIDRLEIDLQRLREPVGYVKFMNHNFDWQLILNRWRKSLHKP